MPVTAGPAQGAGGDGGRQPQHKRARPASGMDSVGAPGSLVAAALLGSRWSGGHANGGAGIPPQAGAPASFLAAPAAPTGPVSAPTQPGPITEQDLVHIINNLNARILAEGGLQHNGQLVLPGYDGAGDGQGR